jgi:integrase
MAMVYQKGRVFENGKRIKRWYGQFRVYRIDRDGKEVEKTRKVVLGLKSQFRKHQAEEKLQQIIRRENGASGTDVGVTVADDSVTLDWFVEQKYLPIRRGRWHRATRDKTGFEIKKYLVEKFRNVPLRDVGLFEMQTWLNDLAEKYSDSIVRHAFVNLRSIMKLAHKLNFLPENPAEETAMPVTRPVDRQTMTPEQIASLMSAIEDPHDLCLMCIGLFCATRTSETFGLQWKSYRGDRLMIENTAYEGELYRGQVKTKASRNSIPIPDDIIPVVEAWRQLCPDTSAEALMFPTFGRKKRKGQKVPRRAKNFLKWRIYAIADRLKIPRELVTFQVMRRTLGTDLQKHGTMKDAQGALRHASIKTTADVYMQEIPASVRAAINSRTRAILAMQSAISTKAVYATCPNVSNWQEATLASA